MADAFGFEIEPAGETIGHCDCCGKTSRCVWGWARGAGDSLSCYYVRWTVGNIKEHSANFDLILGSWGDSAAQTDRTHAALEYRLLDEGPTFRVIDAGERQAMRKDLAAHSLARNDIAGQPLAPQMFALVDAVLAADQRLAELRGSWIIG